MPSEENSAPSSYSLLNVNAKVLEMLYQDLAQPGVRQVGKALETVLGLGNTVLLPIKLGSEKLHLLYAANLEKYRQRLATVPEDQIVEVAPEIGVPILENLEKTTSERIRELYINLLANASIVDFVANTHPRFVSIIENVTADEVRVLELLQKSSIPFISIEMHVQLNNVAPEIRFASNTGIAVLHERATMLEKDASLFLPERARFYFQNLEGLGLLQSENQRFMLGNAYDTLLHSFSEVINEKINDATISVQKGSFQLTETGKLFLKACEEPKK